MTIKKSEEREQNLSKVREGKNGANPSAVCYLRFVYAVSATSLARPVSPPPHQQQI